MDQQTLLYVMVAFVAVSAIALAIQAGLLFGIYRASRSVEQRISALAPKVESLVESSRKTVEESRKQILDITQKTGEILDSAKSQVAKVEEILTDVSSRARVQMERAEMVLDDTVSRAHETVALIHSGIMRPLREILGVAAGLRTAFAYLFRGSRSSVAQATHDEEMFI